MNLEIELGRVLYGILFFYGVVSGQELMGNDEVVDLNDVQFLLYTRKNAENPIVLDPNTPDGLNQVITSLKTIVYIPGFSRTNISTTDLHLKEGYIRREEVNFIYVCWYKLCKAFWSTTIQHSIHPVSKHIAGLINRLVDEHSARLEDFHLIGFGLGAQIAGLTANHINGDKKVRRITGLDPSKHFFEYAPRERRLDDTDADFVQVIHTGGRMISFEAPMGHADFYPNGGISPQPICSPLSQSLQFYVQPWLLLTCSHLMSMVYYIQSIYQPKLLVAQECDSWAEASGGRCENGSTALMGYGTPISTRGVFYINITSFDQFSYAIQQLQGDDEDEDEDNEDSSSATTTTAKPERTQSIKFSPDAKAKKEYYDEKHKKKNSDEFKKSYGYYPWDEKDDESIEIVGSKEENSTEYNEDTFPEEEGDKISEVRHAIEDVERYRYAVSGAKESFDRTVKWSDQKEKEITETKTSNLSRSDANTKATSIFVIFLTYLVYNFL